MPSGRPTACRWTTFSTYVCGSAVAVAKDRQRSVRERRRDATGRARRCSIVGDARGEDFDSELAGRRRRGRTGRGARRLGDLCRRVEGLLVCRGNQVREAKAARKPSAFSRAAIGPPHSFLLTFIQLRYLLPEKLTRHLLSRPRLRRSQRRFLPSTPLATLWRCLLRSLTARQPHEAKGG